ncbi:MAG: hypothetical protein WAV07_10645, partial [Candidatus Contendobacter sp.]
AALRAYAQGEAGDAVRERLKAISIRSPYRDLRQALAALLKLETDTAGALALIERIPPTSPYQDLVELVRASATADPARALLALDPAPRELAGGLLGLDSRQIKLLKDWARLGDNPSDKAKFDFIVANLALFDREPARRACLALLPAYPQGLKTYTHLFGPLPPFEAQRLQALQAERKDDLDNTLGHWQACVNLLRNEPDPDHRLTAALILRHMVELLHKGDDGWDDGSRLRDCLEQSLRFDPDDRDTYLQLAILYKDADNDKEYHHWVEEAVKRFPNDPQVLLAAVKTATARKAYKKAAGFAARVLELDPINSKARAVLINAHMGHARKLMRADKYVLAEKELDSAGQLERDNTHTGIVEINRGLLALQQRQRDLGRQWLREGVGLAGSPLLAWLRLAVEALRLKLDPADFQRDAELGDPRKLSASRADLLALAQLLNAYREEEVKDLDTVLEDLEKPLQRAIKTLISEDDLLLMCECLHQAPHYGLLEYAATRALEIQPDRPLFVYYQIYGRAEGDLDQVKDRDYDRLEHALEQAAAAKDHRSILLIERFLADNSFPFPVAPRGGPRPTPSMPSPLPMPPKMRREFEEIRGQLERLPPALRGRMLDQILDSLPPDDDFPPEIQRAIMKMMLLGEGIENLLDELPDLPLPFPGGRGGRGKRRS